VRRVLTFLALVLGATPSLARGQVGYPPERSPYRDIEGRSDFYLMTGYWSSARDYAGVGPHSGPLVGARYDVLLANTPLFLAARVTHVFTDRTVLNPFLPAAQRITSVSPNPVNASLNIADIGLGVQLTGQKSFHGFIPVINIGGGVVSDLGGSGGPGHYHLGTQPAATWGGGLRWVPGGRLTLRADADVYLYPHRYPSTYKTITGDGTSVIPPAHALVAWRNNGAFTFGAWYAFFR
jgi:hypothetical protein